MNELCRNFRAIKNRIEKIKLSTKTKPICTALLAERQITASNFQWGAWAGCYS